MTDEQRRIILHALGLDQAKIGYRNRYIGNETTVLESIREQGWMVREPFGSQLVRWKYIVTKRGLAAAGLSPKKLDHEEREEMPD